MSSCFVVVWANHPDDDVMTGIVHLRHRRVGDIVPRMLFV